MKANVDIVAIGPPGRGYRPPRTDWSRSTSHRLPFAFATIACELVAAVTIMVAGLPL